MDTGHKRRELQRRNKPTTYAFWKPILSQDISAQGYLLCSRETGGIWQNGITFVWFENALQKTEHLS